MLDTNVFNALVDSKVGADSLRDRHLIGTHIQYDEIMKTQDIERRSKLLAIFDEFIPARDPTVGIIPGVSVPGGAYPGGSGQIPTESAVWDVSKWDQAKWSTQDNTFAGMAADLDREAPKRAPANIRDALIAETALRNGLVLVTSDSALFKVATKYSVPCCNLFTLNEV